MKDTKKPGLLFVINCFSLGGAEIFMMRLGEFLKSDFEIFILTVFEKQNDLDFLKTFLQNTNGKEIKKYPGLSSKLNWLYWKMNALGKMIGVENVYLKLATLDENKYYTKIIKKNGIKIMNSHLSVADRFSLEKIRNSIDIPWAITMHSSYNPIHFKFLKESKRNLFIGKSKQTLLSADHIFCVSEINKEIFKLNNWRNLPEKVYLGLKKTNLEAVSSSCFTFCMVGRGIKEKGWELALKAFEKIEKKHKDIRLLIIAPESDYILSLKVLYQNNNNIRFTGHLSNPMPLMSEASCGLLPSFGESLPYSVIEFLSLGVPIIVSNRGEMPLMIDSDLGLAGAIIKDDDNGNPSEENLLMHMESFFLHSNSTKSEFKKRATLAFEKFSMEKCGGRYLTVFKSLIE